MNKTRSKRNRNLPITNTAILQYRFHPNEKFSFSSFKPAIMTVGGLISPNGGAMSWFPYGEVGIKTGAPPPVKDYIHELYNSGNNIPEYIITKTFEPITDSGPYLMVDLYFKKIDTTFSIGFLNEECGFDLTDSHVANLFLAHIHESLTKFQFLYG
ncbi:MAG: hypothetical protein FWD78_03030 [Treponema sp.]|nr:hypothetical protein [Treponema sp.]